MASDKRVVQIFRRAVNKAKNINRWVKPRSSVEGFFASKGAAYAIPDGDFARKASLRGGEIQSHLQGMVNVIRDEDTMRLVVKVESEAKYTRYLSIVTTYGLSDEEESVVLGFDWIEDKVTLGLVIPLWSNVSTTLDGDGGFEIKTEHCNYVFKPVSVQTLWTALLWIHKCLRIAHRAKHFDGGLSHAWLDYYQNRISSPRECINFWQSMDDVENKREICFSYFDKVFVRDEPTNSCINQDKNRDNDYFIEYDFIEVYNLLINPFRKTDEELLKGSIRNKLKEILTRFDLEEVTCRQVREALEAEMKMSLQHLKGYVDEQLFVILGQMESASKITDHLYLGSEWNACNLQELKENNVGSILNVTKEVDNFFPGTFEYMNIRIYDIKEADLLRHWGKTYRFIHKAKERGLSALVHCRRGISRSASSVIAYLMKENNMSLADAMKFVKSRRSIVQPNSGFWKQLIIYEGILKSSRNRHNSLFRRRSNSDTVNVAKLHHKKARHKNDADNVDNTPERAHTLPRMASKLPPEGEGDGEGVQTSDGADQLDEEGSPDSMSSNEDVSSNSNSDEDLLSKTKRVIRRTVSEPAMAHADDVMMTSPTRKPRARTFAERQAADTVRSPTRIVEDRENEDDGIWVHSKDGGDNGEVLQQEAEVSESMSECLNPDTVVISEPSASEENVVIVNKTSEADEKMETSVSDTTNTEQLTSTGEAEPTKVSDDAKQVPCEESPRGDSLRDSPREDVGSPRENLDSPLEGMDSPRENVDSPLEDMDSPRENVGSPREEVESPREVVHSTREDVNSSREEFTREDHETPPPTPRQRSRSIGEKLEDKMLVKQGKFESSDNFKKVKLRGRVKRRERKAKSDLQLSGSGFVKRHTQIIEEQMLFSLLMNSDETLATLAVDFWENNGGDNSNNGKQNANCEAQCSGKNLDLESAVTSVTTVTDSEKYSGNQLEENRHVYEKNSVISEAEKDCVKSTEDECCSSENSKKECDSNCEQNAAQVSEKISQNSPENCSGKKRCQELQDIVQEVNAEAKRDIATQSDTIRAAVVSQNELRHTSEGDDVTIDQMTWIDLTQHHGDVVKRRSAAFENNAKNGTKASLPQSPLSRDNSPPRDDHEPNTCQEREQTQGNRMDDNTNSETVFHATNRDVPKLDLGDLAKDESLMQRSNSIIVEDYNSWEASSVQDRTRILENIIAKTGGSFPSPRSRARQDKLSNSEVEGQLQPRMNELNINTSSEAEEGGNFHHSHGEDREASCPVEKRSEEPGDDSVFGDAPVKSLVDKFEDWG